jgi:hypothetical protein
LLCGWVKDIIISQHVINQKINQMLLKMSTTQKIWMEFGHTFTIHIVLKRRRLWLSLNLEMMM